MGCSLGPLVSEDGGGYHTGKGRAEVSLDTNVSKTNILVIAHCYHL